MKTSLLKTVRHPAQEKRGKQKNRKIFSFLVCVVIAAFLWTVNALSQKYTDVIPFGVQYRHLPSDRKLMPSPDAINLTLTASGYNLLAYKLGIKQPLINIDANVFRHKDNQYIYNLQSQLHQDKIRDQLGEQTELVAITPDTLYLRPDVPKQ